MGIFLLPESLGLNFQVILIGTNNCAKSTFHRICTIQSVTNPWNCKHHGQNINSCMGALQTTEVVPKDWDAKSHLWFTLILGPFLKPGRYCLCLSFLINVYQEQYSSSNSSWLSSTELSHPWCLVCVADYLASYFCPAAISNCEWSRDGNWLLIQVTRLNTEEGFIFSSLVILCYCGCHLGWLWVAVCWPSHLYPAHETDKWIISSSVAAPFL